MPRHQRSWGGAGIDGERSGMWREMARIIHEVQPRFAFVENSPMLTSRGLGTVLGDLAAMGFDARWGVLGAADVGANHQRNRIWIVANANSESNAMRGNSQNHAGGVEEWRVHIGRSLGNSGTRCEEVSGQSAGLADTDSAGLGTGGWEGLHSKRETGLIAAPSNPTMAQPENTGLERRENGRNGKSSKSRFGESSWSIKDNWVIEPNVGRVADGVAARVDRLKAIGNGQVPLCAATAWQLLSK